MNQVGDGVCYRLVYSSKANSERLTSSGNLGLLNSGTVEERTSLEDLQVVLASVGDSGLDLSVANKLKLDIKGSRGLARGSSGQGSQSGEAEDELHDGYKILIDRDCK
jgi:hypothetical protein